MARRTQAERRAATQGRLEEAAIASMVARGAARASTSDICARAGVSSGALFQHYATKEDLLVAAVTRLYARLREEFRAELAAADAPDRVRAALDLMWRSFYRPEVVATLELWGLSRTDEALRDRLTPMLDEHWQSLALEAAASFVAETAGNPHFDSLLALTMAAVQSAATGAVITGAPPPDLDRHLDVLAALFRRTS